jgi:hypothetical protein
LQTGQTRAVRVALVQPVAPVPVQGGFVDLAGAPIGEEVRQVLELASSSAAAIVLPGCWRRARVRRLFGNLGMARPFIRLLLAKI